MNTINRDKILLICSIIFALIGLGSLIINSNWFALAGFIIIYALIISIQIYDMKLTQNKQ